MRPASDLSTSLEQVRQLHKDGENADAINILQVALDKARGQIGVLRETYLLLIKSYVLQGNHYKLKDPVAMELHYKEARSLIEQCLTTRELRHVLPEPGSPEEMDRFFDDVRARMFGSFRVLKLKPPHAVVLLDADTLRTLPGDSLLGDVNIPVGRHSVLVRAHGYKDLKQEITISPGSKFERDYQLARKRSRTWYAGVGAGALGVVGGVIALVSGKAGTSTAEPLPGPPPPPAK